ncbi:hypothetical protein EV667_1341 [Ancylobacter aquaticus]|uniref:Uncharacterized protein n=1 Tax=Ancylobacter aquaticus TaxID=100 RepID=A0A4R1IB34_ANCAQ|nr:hypothetical protein [Ancylobacter aquaticus]TCK31235.1 hypothetical protein EV667_1341 [Ancylobacter aquaticus]
MTTDEAAHSAAQDAVAAFAIAAEASGYDMASIGEALVHGGMIVMSRALGAEQAGFTGLVAVRAAIAGELNGH